MRFINLPNLLALLIFFLGVISFSNTLIRKNAPLNIDINSGKNLEVEQNTKLERIELVIFNPNSQGPFNSGSVRNIEPINLQVPASDNRRLEVILATLREAMSSDQACQDLEVSCEAKKTLWPQSLLSPQAFVTNFVSGKPIVILNFGLSHPVEASVGQEQALLDSIRETLNRNGISSTGQITKIYILVNGKASPTFLGHIALVSVLD